MEPRIWNKPHIWNTDRSAAKVASRFLRRYIVHLYVVFFAIVKTSSHYLLIIFCSNYSMACYHTYYAIIYLLINNKYQLLIVIRTT